MSDSITIALFTAIGCATAAFTAFSIKTSSRLARIETWLEIIGLKTAKILHSPGDALGIDSYLDKYLKQDQSLSYEDWTALKLSCEKVESNAAVPEGKRLMAGFVAAVAIHNMHKRIKL
jgi:hypothetical protein